MDNNLDVHTFEECLDISNEEDLKRHLLLGNGFSISFDPNFSYLSLINSTEKLLRDLISQYNNHEMAMNDCHTHENRENIKIKKEDIKRSIIEKILELHPSSVFDIDHRYTNNCYENFLTYFDKIFTTNFDLLLYNITIQRAYLTNKKNNLFDGFYNQRDCDGKAKYIFRDIRKSSKNAKVLYLHGALHIFPDMKDFEYEESLFINHADSDQKNMKIEDRKTVVRHRSGDTKGRIKQQILEKIPAQLPIILLAENYSQKSINILFYSYLSTVYELFKEKDRNRKRSLFIFGHSLNKTLDFHISHEIQMSGNIKYIFYGIHVSLFESIEQLEEEKNRIYKLLIEEAYSKDPQYCRKLYFFDSSKMDIWGKETIKPKTNIKISQWIETRKFI